jgi:alpha-tubulin suppressor-like RCC1 family protein
LVSGGNTYTTVTTGYDFACALTDTGLAHCWGGNDSGQLGDATDTDSWVPVAVAGGTSFTQIEGCAGHVCALDATGTVFCWGSGRLGQLGDNRFSDANVPQAVVGGFEFTKLFPGSNHSGAVRSNAEAMCWGYNFRGQVGDGTFFNFRGAPTTVSGDHAFTHLGTGSEHTCGVTTGDALYCWGNNDQGQFGLGFTSRRSTPALVTGVLTFMVPPRE